MAGKPYNQEVPRNRTRHPTQKFKGRKTQKGWKARGRIRQTNTARDGLQTFLKNFIPLPFKLIQSTEWQTSMVK